MRDSLGGILTGGLLGNPIIGYFNLSIFNIIDIIIEDTTGGHSSGVLSRPEEEYNRVWITIRMFNREYKEYYTFSRSKINIFVKFVNFVRSIKDKLISVTIKKSNIKGIQVKINEKD